MTEKPAFYDLTDRIPNVLLVGNGVLRSCALEKERYQLDWLTCIQKMSVEPLSIRDKLRLPGIPYSLQATILAPNNDQFRRSRYKEVFQTLHLKDDTLLRSLVSLPFDAVLTTNYTYEIENIFHPEFDSLKNKAIFVRETEQDTKYLLHTYNQFQDSPQIWHIHGEMRRPSSIVLTHDEYARLIRRLVEVNATIGDKHFKFRENVSYKTWLDYLLTSNLYIVGLGVDFSEMDLWWILNRRIREKGDTGRITYFKTIYDSPSIINALGLMNVCIEENDIDAKDPTEYFKIFYTYITRWIEEDLEKRAKEKR